MFLGADMSEVEKVARAMARVDDVDPDRPLKGFRRIVGKSMIVNKYDPHLAALELLHPACQGVHCGVSGSRQGLTDALIGSHPLGAAGALRRRVFTLFFVLQTPYLFRRQAREDLNPY